MQVSTAALFLLHLALTIPPAFHCQPKIPESLNPAPNCCVKYHEKVLPRKLVAGYTKALNCYLPAIIFITRKNREVCANPNDSWVQEYIKDPNLPLLPPRSLVRVKTAVSGKANPRPSTPHDAQASVEAQVWRRQV
ncbi:C-C motif chemokine 16 [Choloepus didactylus]|uniref:C-C motif chemokine 16 n=1 Tax=Choloepus didactylus TaxID=27675 RepID=UPI00189D519A|nr:C-C motif chemokine 16 [Choloepus didactylus]